MKTLNEDAHPNAYSQFGEDGMILRLLDEAGTTYGTCVDIGANAGLHLSNTAALWKDRGWHGVLVEASEEHRASLEELARSYNLDVCLERATPDNINEFITPNTKVLSIDVDDNDYQLWEAVSFHPEVVVIEYNPTIPYWLDVVGAPGKQFGASVAALIRLAKTKGYELAGATHCNLLFTTWHRIAQSYETDLAHIVGVDSLAILATDYVGRPYVGGSLSFGLTPWDDLTIRTIDEAT